MSKYISVGKILNFHGVRGEAKVGYSKNQQEFMTMLSDVFVYKNNENLTIIVTIHTTISQIEKVYLLP